MRTWRAIVASIVAALALAGTAAGVSAKTTKVVSPVDALDAFEFTFTFSVKGGAGGPVASIALKSDGVFKAPRSQDCTGSVDAGFIRLSERIVAVGTKVWIDDGNGLRRAKASDADLAIACLSSPAFWSEFDFAVPPGLSGVREDTNGIATERVDLSTDLDQLPGVSSLFEDLGSDVTFQNLQVWIARKGGWIARADIALTAATTETCANFLGDTFPVQPNGPCVINISYEISRANDKTLEIATPKIKAN